MKKFKDFISEAATSEASDMEEAIVDVWNGEALPAKFKKYEAPTLKIVDYLQRGVGIKPGPATWSGRSDAPLTEFWKSFGATDRTPKADLVISGERISLKQGAAQLMSGSKSESFATFMAAAGSLPGTEFADQIGKLFDGFVRGLTEKGTVKDALKLGEDRVIAAAEENHKATMAALTKAFQTYPAFQREFLKEAASGFKKFGVNSPAAAEWILAITKSGENSKLYKIDDPAFLDKLAKVMKVQVRFKSSSQKSKGTKTGRYSYWSVVSLITSVIKEGFDAVPENLLTEGLLSDIWSKIISKVREVFKKVLEWLSQKASNVVSFFELDENSIDIFFNEKITIQ